jgi:hypothetical protein
MRRVHQKHAFLLCFFLTLLILILSQYSLDDEDVVTDETRQLGLLIARGIHVASIFPLDGSRKLEENPFA